MFTDTEIRLAIAKAEKEINFRAGHAGKYVRGYNDCLALLMSYDTHLRGMYSKAYGLIDFNWESSKEFGEKLYYEKRMTPAELTQYCGYKIVLSKRPQLGDIAFENGSAMIAGDAFWISTCESNRGVVNKKQRMFLERHLSFLARPEK